MAKRSSNSITWDFDTISSVVFLILFLGIVAGAFYLTRKGAEAAESTRAALKEKGVTMQDGQVRVTTSQVAPSREEYIASAQRAFESSAARFAAVPEALSFGRDLSSGNATSDGIPEGSAAAEGLKAANGRERNTNVGVPMDVVDTGIKEKRGMFRRKTKVA